MPTVVTHAQSFVVRDFSQCTLDRFCQLLGDEVHLASGFLAHIDQGRVNHNRNEEIGAYAWARQQISLPVAEPSSGALSLLLHEYIDNHQPLELLVNGREFFLAPDPELQGAFYWRILELPPGTLHPGENEVVVRAANLPFHSWILAVDVGGKGGNSAKSWNGGTSWHDQRLGFDYSLCGEYVIRWWCEASPPVGTVLSPVFCLPESARFNTVVDAVAEGEGLLEFSGRWGSSLDCSDTSWSEWQSFPLLAEGPCFQWQVRLCRHPHFALPVLRRVSFSLESKQPQSPSQVPLGELRTHLLPTYPIVMEQLAAPQLEASFEAESLSPLLSGFHTDFDRARALCSWVHAQWIHNGDPGVYTPWHAATVLDWQRSRRGHGSTSVTGWCVHFAITLAQLCTAAGIPARGVILGQRTRTGADGHFVCEVFCRNLGKWVMFDPDFDYYFAYQDKPLTVLEIHRLWQIGAANDIRMVEGSSFCHNPLGPTWPKEHILCGGYRWFGVPLRQDWASRPDLQLLNHGAITYHETDVLWWSQEREHRLYFPLITQREKDIELFP